MEVISLTGSFIRLTLLQQFPSQAKGVRKKLGFTIIAGMFYLYKLNKTYVNLNII